METPGAETERMPREAPERSRELMAALGGQVGEGKLEGSSACCFDGRHVDRWKSMNVDVDETTRGPRVGVAIHRRHGGLEDSVAFRRT